MSLILALSTQWLLEIMNMGYSVIPNYDLIWNLKILERILKLWGANPPSEWQDYLK